MENKEKHSRRDKRKHQDDESSQEETSCARDKKMRLNFEERPDDGNRDAAAMAEIPDNEPVASTSQDAAAMAEIPDNEPVASTSQFCRSRNRPQNLRQKTFEEEDESEEQKQQPPPQKQHQQQQPQKQQQLAKQLPDEVLNIYEAVQCLFGYQKTYFETADINIFGRETVGDLGVVRDNTTNLVLAMPVIIEMRNEQIVKLEQKMKTIHDIDWHEQLKLLVANEVIRCGNDLGDRKDKGEWLSKEDYSLLLWQNLTAHAKYVANGSDRIHYLQQKAKNRCNYNESWIDRV